MYKFWFVPIAAALCGPAFAHDFWMQPNDFVLEEPGTVGVALYVGHGNDKSFWAVGREHVMQFNSIGPDGLVDRKDTLRTNGNRLLAVVPLTQPGAHILALQSHSSLSRLPGVRFNDYVATEGITPIAEARRAKGDRNSEGVEFYSRRSKTIVQIGPVNARAIARATTPVNLKLEIVPLRHPQTLGNGSTMPVRVLFNGEPLRGGLVKLTDLAADAEPIATVRTNASGIANFRIPRASQWQMNVVWSEAAPARSEADYLTIFSSLAFETLQ
ncbi:MAG: DUF4198 domain-containing protein [Alteraurantiacibacter sp.]